LLVFDEESIVHDLRCDDRLREVSDDGELVSEIPVERFEVRGQLHGRLTLPVRRDEAVVDVHHVRQFDEGVGEVLVRRVERMVDLERSRRFLEVAGDVHLALEIPRVTLAAR
jgi:hypothetical protein